MVECTSIASYSDLLNACCLEWTSLQATRDDNESIVVVGSYELSTRGSVEADASSNEVTAGPDKASVQARDTRSGSLSIFRVDAHDQFNLAQQIETPAILDVICLNQGVYDAVLVAAAEACGSVSLWRLDATTRYDIKLHLSHRLHHLPAETLCLSVDATDVLAGRADLATSNSDGTLSLLQLTPSGLCCAMTWLSHDFEAWTVYMSRNDKYRLFSGGDDSLFKGWDARTAGNPIFVDKSHDAGVTCVSQVPGWDHCLVTGSYDGRVRLFDDRNRKKPLLVTSTEVNGGIWRLKWKPSTAREEGGTPLLLGVAAMHAGCAILRLELDPALSQDAGYASNAAPRMTITDRFTEHRSMAYGLDWYRGSDLARSNLLASCSFYDHIVHAWRCSTPS